MIPTEKYEWTSFIPFWPYFIGIIYNSLYDGQSHAWENMFSLYLNYES